MNASVNNVQTAYPSTEPENCYLFVLLGVLKRKQ